MCCEDCPKYEKCEENNRLKENCCPKCQEYYDCAGASDKKDSFEIVDDDPEFEDYS